MSNPDTPEASRPSGNRRWLLAGILSFIGGGSLALIQSGWLTGPWQYLPQALLLAAVIYFVSIGADWLVDSSTAIARHLGVSDLVIGLTVVAFGTSAPEMAASMVAGFQGKGDITIANIVGSNIFNLCFILGGVALLVRSGLQADRDLLVRDGPVLLGGTVLLFVFIGAIPGSTPAAPASTSGWLVPFNLRLEWLEGLILVSALFVYLYALYRVMRKSMKSAAEGERPEGTPWRHIPKLLLGLLLVVGGCDFLVGHAEGSGDAITGFGALWFARMWDVPDYVVGVTIIAAGTSAPEFVVSLVAATRGAFGISAGNLLGSDIFNIFGVVGLAGLVLQEPVAQPVMVSYSAVPSLLALSVMVVVTLFFMWTGRRVSRIEGLILVLIGVARWIMDFASRG